MAYRWEHTDAALAAQLELEAEGHPGRRRARPRRRPLHQPGDRGRLPVHHALRDASAARGRPHRHDPHRRLRGVAGVRAAPAPSPSATSATTSAPGDLFAVPSWAPLRLRVRRRARRLPLLRRPRLRGARPRPHRTETVVKLATIRTANGTRAVRVDDDAAVETRRTPTSARCWPGRTGAPRPRRPTGPRTTSPGWTTRRWSRGRRRSFCVGLNYRTHILEMGRELPEYPTLFAKFARALVGAYDPVVLPAGSTQVDWEAELGVVVGARSGTPRPEQAARGDRRLHRRQRRHRAGLPVPHGAVAAGQDLRAQHAGRAVAGHRRRARRVRPATSTATWCRRPTPPTCVFDPADAGRLHLADHHARARATSSPPAPPAASGTPASHRATSLPAASWSPGSRASASCATSASRRA